MAKDPQLGETIIWRGKPQVVETPPLFKAISALWFLVSASATCLALVVAWAIAFRDEFEARGRVIRDGSDKPRLGRVETILRRAAIFRIRAAEG